MDTKKSISVFCSASNVIDPAYNVIARDLVREASLAGYTIVSGGTVKGTMGEIGRELAAVGGKHVGIIPRFMEPLVFPELSEVIWTDTMAERKALMREKASVAVALPGGIGTLDEFIETMVLLKLGKWEGRMYVLDVDGFYEPFKALLDHYVATGMLDECTRSLVKFPTTVVELIDMLKG